MRVKIVVHVPTAAADAVRAAVGGAGGGQIGEYSFCSFSVMGVGRFKPSPEANPHIGSANELEAVEEVRIEVTCNKADAPTICSAVKEAHPYEEATIDVYQLLEVSSQE